MSGGIFPGYPFTLNIKCIIFSLIIMALYTYCPPKVESKIKIFLIYFMIFVISYVTMAWYDYYYACSQLPLQRSTIGITGALKPPVHEEEKQLKQLMTVEEVDKNHKTIFWLHFALIVPFLAYIGIKKDKTHPRAFDLLLVLTIFTAIYHGVRILSTIHN